MPNDEGTEGCVCSTLIWYGVTPRDSVIYMCQYCNKTFVAVERELVK